MNYLNKCFLFIVGVWVSSAHAQNVLPDFYSEPGNGLNKRDVVSSAPNEAIDPFSGGLSLVHTDLVVPGDGGMDIRIQRSYSSNNIYYRRPGSTTQNLELLTRTTPYGVGWSLHFGRVRLQGAVPEGLPNETLLLGVGACNGENGSVRDNPVLEMPDGSQRQLFCNDFPNTYSTNADFITKDNWAITILTRNSPILNVSGFLAIDPNGMKYTMDRRFVGGTTTERDQYVWYTTQIEDRHGNQIFIEYDNDSTGEGPIYDRVYSDDGRSVTFNYDFESDPNRARLRNISYGNRRIDYGFTTLRPDVNQVGGTYRLLTSVDLPGSNSGEWRYRYYNRSRGAAGDNLLQTMTYPGGGTTTYDYEYQCFLYDRCTAQGQYFTLVVKSKVNDGRDIARGTWRFAYSSTSDLAFDTTTIEGPNADEEYRHYRVDRRVNLGLGLNLQTPLLWRVGLLDQKRIFSKSGQLLQTERYTYGNRRISRERYERFPYTQAIINGFDQDVLQHYITQRTLIRDGTNYITRYENFADNINPHRIVEIGQQTKTTNLTYYPRLDGQNIVNQVKDETLTNNPHRRILRTFDGRGRVSSETRYGVRTTYAYDARGNVSAMRDARGQLTRLDQYFRGVPGRERHPEGVTITRAIDTYGNITRQRDGRGNVTDYSYDRINRVEHIDLPRGTDITIAWTPNRRTTTRGSYRQTVDADGFGRTICTQTSGIYVGEAYNAAGNQSYQTYPNYSSCTFSRRTRFTYDGLNRPRRTTHPDSAFREIRYLSGNRQELRDERGLRFTSSYRSFSDPDAQELMAVTGPESLAYNVARNILGQPTVINRNGVRRTYQYGSTIFLQSETNPETGTTTYGRDANGNMISRRVGASPITRYEYDGLNRNTVINYPNDTPDVTMTYDGNNNLTRMVSGLADLRYRYDANNNLTREQQVLAGTNYFINYVYNGLDYLSSMTYPDNGQVQYSPNSLGWPTKATPYLTSVTYNAVGQPLVLRYGNGRATTHTYTNRQWPYTTQVSGGVTNRANSYDAAGNLTGIDDRFENLYDRVMTYDGLNRLRTARGAWGQGSISYSTDDDIVSKRMGTQALNYTYAGNKLSSVSGLPNFITSAQYDHDVYGNIIRKSTNSAGWTYDYDDAPNLRQVFSQSGDLLRSYDYSGQNQRIRSIKSDETRIHIVTQQGQQIAEFVTQGEKPNITNVYLGNRLIAELESVVNGNPNANIFGFGFGGSANRTRYTRSFNIDKIPDSYRYCVDGYGINSSTEVSVSINGQAIGHLRPGGNPTKTCIDVNPAILRLGANSITFTQSSPGQTWGVSDFQSFPVFLSTLTPPMMLLLNDDTNVTPTQPSN